MSEVTIYQALRSGGLSHVGACAMMGNMWCESAMISINVQDNSPLGDRDYTYNVDNGIYSEDDFAGDRYGYGLCQWTYAPRKRNLYEALRGSGRSIGDERGQCEFCIAELQTSEFWDLYAALCQETDNLYTLTERICKEFEKPAVNNVKPRYEAAQKYYKQFAAVGGSVNQEFGCTDGDACDIDFSTIPEGDPYVEIGVPELRNGSKGNAVKVLQTILKQEEYLSGFRCIDGIFGPKTETAVKKMQAACNQEATGIMDAGSWQVLFL